MFGFFETAKKKALGKGYLQFIVPMCFWGQGIHGAMLNSGTWIRDHKCCRLAHVFCRSKIRPPKANRVQQSLPKPPTYSALADFMNDGFGVVSANHSHTVLVGGWTTHLKNMLVKLDHETPNRDKNKKYFKPPPSCVNAVFPFITMVCLPNITITQCNRVFS